MIGFSPTTNAFHIVGLPADAVPVSAEAHLQLLAARGRGCTLAVVNGSVVAVEPSPLPLSAQRAAIVAAVKAEAQRRILSIAPLWRQSNDAAAIAGMALQLATTDSTTIDASAALARRAAIDVLRDTSDAIEASVATMNSAALAAFDLTAAEHWPAPSEENP